MVQLGKQLVLECLESTISLHLLSGCSFVSVGSTSTPFPIIPWGKIYAFPSTSDQGRPDEHGTSLWSHLCCPASAHSPHLLWSNLQTCRIEHYSSYWIRRNWDRDAWDQVRGLLWCLLTSSSVAKWTFDISLSFSMPKRWFIDFLTSV